MHCFGMPQYVSKSISVFCTILPLNSSSLRKCEEILISGCA